MVRKTNFFRRYVFSLGLLFSLAGCEYFWGADSYYKAIFLRASNTTNYQAPKKAGYKLSSSKKSAAASHSLSVDFSGETLETYNVVLTYPKEFKFKEFTAGNAIGTYKLEVNGGSTYSYNIIAASGTMAFVDQNKSGKYDTVFEAIINYKKSKSSHAFNIILPDGGDGDSSINGGAFNGTMSITLNEGVLDNPAKPGPSYNITAKFTSVDPDSGGANDNKGTAPKKFTVVKKLRIT